MDKEEQIKRLAENLKNNGCCSSVEDAIRTSSRMLGFDDSMLDNRLLNEEINKFRGQNTVTFNFSSDSPKKIQKAQPQRDVRPANEISSDMRTQKAFDNLSDKMAYSSYQRESMMREINSGIQQKREENLETQFPPQNHTPQRHPYQQQHGQQQPYQQQSGQQQPYQQQPGQQQPYQQQSGQQQPYQQQSGQQQPYQQQPGQQQPYQQQPGQQQPYQQQPEQQQPYQQQPEQQQEQDASQKPESGDAFITEKDADDSIFNNAFQNKNQETRAEAGNSLAEGSMKQHDNMLQRNHEPQQQPFSQGLSGENASGRDDNKVQKEDFSIFEDIPEVDEREFSQRENGQPRSQDTDQFGQEAFSGRGPAEDMNKKAEEKNEEDFFSGHADGKGNPGQPSQENFSQQNNQQQSWKEQFSGPMQEDSQKDNDNSQEKENKEKKAEDEIDLTEMFNFAKRDRG